MAAVTRHIYEFSGFTLDPRTRELKHGDDRVALTPRAIDTLIELVAHGGDVVERRTLLARVWPDATVSPATLTQNVYTVRKELESLEQGHEFVETVPRIGYRFAVPVTKVELGSPDGAPGEIRSLAVLPFTPLTRNEDTRFLGLGLADALIARLSEIGAMRIRPTSAILKYADDGIDLREAARELKVDAAVQGTVQQAGDRVRVAVQLVDPNTASIRWAESFDAESASLFELQDEISRRIAAELRAELTAERAAATSRRAEVNTEAHQAYMRGRWYWNQRDARSLRQAIRCFDRAIEREPEYARAYSGRADARSLLPLYDDASPGEAFPAALADAERALELDEHVAEAHASLAYVRMYHEWRWAEAETGFRRAIALDADYATAYHWLGFLLAALGRHEESVATLSYASQLDPPSLSIAVDHGMGHYFARDYDRALELMRSAVEIDDRFAYARFGLAWVHAATGDHAHAVEHARAAAELSGDNTAMLAVLGHALALAGERDEAHSIVRRLDDERDGDGPRYPSRTALIRAALGETEAAIDDLGRACTIRSRFVALLDVWPAFDALRKHRGFAELLARTGLGQS